ncbi:MAG: hypothetical protein EOP69_01105 [Spirochaetia bacterium]|nr:MAG: hypothetical protein EOP69_01105 [Spirochaetia bacterium]
MGNMLIVGLALLAVSAPNPDAPTFERCRAASKNIGRCDWRRGRFIVVSGEHSSRIGFFEGKPSGIAVHQPGTDGPDEYAPQGVETILSRGPASWAADGNYLVCPLRQARAEKHAATLSPAMACLAGAKHLVARRRVGY